MGQQSEKKSLGSLKATWKRVENPPNPREVEKTFTHMIFKHHSLNIGDLHEYDVDYPNNTWDDIADQINKKHGIALITLKPVYIKDNDQSPTRFSLRPFPDQWDTTCLGFIYMTIDNVTDLGITSDSENYVEGIEETLLMELKTYEDYLNGEYYNVDLEFKDHEIYLSGFKTKNRFIPKHELDSWIRNEWKG